MRSGAAHAFCTPLPVTPYLHRHSLKTCKQSARAQSLMLKKLNLLNAEALQRLNQLARGAWLFCSWSRSSFAGGGVGAVTSCCVGSERCQFFNASAAMPLQLLRAGRPAQRSQAGASLPGGPAQRAAHARRGGQHCCSAACGGASRQRTRPCCSDYWNTWSCCSDGQRAGRE